MLVVSRFPNESVMIGSDIKFTVLRVKGYQVQVGIAAPKETPVHREEVYDRIKRDTEDRQPDR